jgi:hypothetical protein
MMSEPPALAGGSFVEDVPAAEADCQEGRPLT